MTKKSVALLYGGESAEHEVSLRSARSVYRALDKSKYQVTLVGISHAGRWLLQSEAQLLEETAAGRKARVSEEGEEVAIVKGGHGARLTSLGAGKTSIALDAVFPVLHGPHGEDGTVQGLLQLAGAPFVGCGVLASALCMDKEVAKRLMCQAGVPNSRYMVCRAAVEANFAAVKEQLGVPVFVKPSNLGSSVGISRAADERSFGAAVELAFRYDKKIIIEQEIRGREIECSVLGNQAPEASLPGEIVPAQKHGFYSYEAKYLDDDGAALLIPARLPAEVVEKVRSMAVRVYQVLCCEGLARVDFFVRQGAAADWEIFVNELNTIPGFTSISMYPKLWEASGLPYPRLLDRLIELAIERSVRQKALNTSAFS